MHIEDPRVRSFLTDLNYYNKRSAVIIVRQSELNPKILAFDMKGSDADRSQLITKYGGISIDRKEFR